MSGKFAAGKAPDAPTGVTSARLNQSLNISGTAPDFNGGLAITDYEYALSTNSGSTYGSWISSGSSSFPFQISNLTNGQAYYVKIRGVNALGGGNEFGPITTGTTPSTVPSAPTNVSGTNYADSRSIVSWTAPADNGAAITGYKVEYAVSPYSSWTTFNADTGNTATSITVTSLNNGTYYKFRISAINAAGTGSTGTSVSAFLPAVIPGVPTSPSISSGSGSITIQWGAPVSDGGAPPVSYTVETQRESDAFVDRGTQTSPYAINGLSNGSTYRARITANTVVGSSATKALTGDAIPGNTPDAPGTPTATPCQNTQSALSWTAAAPNGSAVTDYVVEYSTSATFIGGGTVFADGTSASTSATVTGLNNGTPYYFRVAAVNAIGTGPYSGISTAITPATVPSAPTSVQATSHTNGESSVSWVAPSGAGTGGNGPPFTYTVQYSTSSTFASAVTTVSPTSTSSPKVVNGLTNGTTYYFRVKATNCAGDSSYSTISAGAVPSTVPNAPATPTVTALDAGDTINWTAPATGGRAITAYYYKVSTNDGPYGAEVPVAANVFSFATLNQYSADTKKIQVRAENANGSSGFSTVSANTVAWAQSSGQVQNNPTPCPAPTCADCPEPTCAACNNAPDCSGGCPCDCGTASRTASSGTRGASIIGTRGAPTLGTSTRTCYRWERPAAGSTASGYVYAQNSTSGCGDYSTCTASTCGACSAGTCGDCSAGTCSACSACSGTRTNDTVDFVGPNGYTYYYDGVPGNFVAFIGYPDGSGGCDACPPGQFRVAYYNVTTCLGERRIIATNCNTCQDFG
jgi:titin